MEYDMRNNRSIEGDMRDETQGTSKRLDKL